MTSRLGCRHHLRPFACTYFLAALVASASAQTEAAPDVTAIPTTGAETTDSTTGSQDPAAEPASADSTTVGGPADASREPSLSLRSGETRLHLWYGPNLSVGGSDDLGQPWTSALVIRSDAIDRWREGPLERTRAPYAVGNVEVSHGFNARTELGLRAAASTHPGASYSFGAVVRTTLIANPRKAFGVRAAVNADIEGNPSASLELPLHVAHRRVSIDTGLEASAFGWRMRADSAGPRQTHAWRGYGSFDVPVAVTYVHSRVRAGGHASAGLVADPVGVAPVFVLGAHASVTVFARRFPIDAHVNFALDVVASDTPIVNGRGALGLAKRWP